MPPVLMVSYSGSLGGAERVLLELTDGLDRELCLACPEGPLAAAARARGVRVLGVRERSPELRGSLRDRALAALRLAGFRREVGALACDLAPSLLIANGMRAALALLLGPKVCQAPVVFIHHDLVPGPLIGALVRAGARRAAVVVVPSHTVAADLGPGVAAVIVRPGVAVAPSRSGAGEPASPPIVLVLGAVVGWKRPDLALDVLALVRQRLPEVRMRIVGAPMTSAGDPLVGALLMRAAQSDLAGSVVLTGAVDDPAPEFERASCLLHCAPAEPFGMAVLEALAAGRPVVAPAAGGPAEIVQDGCGLVYSPGDAVAAAAAVTRVLEQPELAASMGAAGRIRAAEYFGLERARREFAAAVGGTGGPPPLDAKSLALVTVTRNSAAVIGALLESVSRYLPGARVVVVDNASTDETVAIARTARDGIAVEVIEMSKNVGFGAASNVGVRAVAADVVALVNPDVELIDDSLLSLSEEARRTRQRLFAPLVLSPDGSRQDTAHPLPGSIASVAHAVLPPALLGRAAVTLGVAPWRSRGPRRVGWVVGCAVLARRDTLLKLGPFDEQIFLYGEDLDLCLRAGEAGVETWFWPAARVVHSGGHSTGPEFAGEPFELLARARHDVVARRMGAGGARRDDATQALTFRSRRALKSALRRDAERERRQLDAIRSVRRSP